MNAEYEEEFHKLKAWNEIQGKDGYNTPCSAKLNNYGLGFKDKEIKFSDEVKKTQYAKETKIKSFGWYDQRLFCI